MRKDERRKDTRIEKHFMVHYKPAKEEGGSWRMSPLKDISKNGARFLYEGDCAMGEQLILELHMPANPAAQRIKATVVRIQETDNRWAEIGVSFNEIDEKTQNDINAIVNWFLKKRR